MGLITYIYEFNTIWVKNPYIMIFNLFFPKSSPSKNSEIFVKAKRLTLFGCHYYEWLQYLNLVFQNDITSSRESFSDFWQLALRFRFDLDSKTTSGYSYKLFSEKKLPSTVFLFYHSYSYIFLVRIDSRNFHRWFPIAVVI